MTSWTPTLLRCDFLTYWPTVLLLCSSLCFKSPPWRFTHSSPCWLCVCVCVCLLCLRTQSTSNGTSSEEAVWQCSYTVQLQVTPQGLMEATWSDVLCGVSAGPMRKHLQNKRPWKSNSSPVTNTRNNMYDIIRKKLTSMPVAPNNEHFISVWLLLTYLYWIIRSYKKNKRGHIFSSAHREASNDYIFYVHMMRHVSMALSDTLFTPFTQEQWQKKALILGNLYSYGLVITGRVCDTVVLNRQNR